jgi:SAM-dependent methyltransferase
MTGTTAAAFSFDDADGYESYMGSWSRAATPVFLQWLSAQPGGRWLDVGCGTGILSEIVARSGVAAAIDAVDQAAPQLDFAARRLERLSIRFQVADAEALPFPDSTFDVVASALVINFLRDHRKGVLEMHRVVRPGGIVAGFVWDFAAERSPSWPMRRALRQLEAPPPAVPGTRVSTLDGLEALFDGAGLTSIATRSFEVSVRFASFEDFWRAQTPSYLPTTRMIDAMSEEDRTRLKQVVRKALDVDTSGDFQYAARAHAVMAVAPASS